MLVENQFPRDNRVRNEARTLLENGYQVSVISLRGRGELAREIVDGGVKVYRVPRLTLFKKLPEGETSWIGSLFSKMKVVGGYVVEYGYFTGACLAISVYAAFNEGFDAIHAHNPPDTLFIVGATHRLFGKKFVFDHHDLSPELYQSRYNKTNGFISGGLRLCEKLSLKLADIAIATNESYKAIDIERNGLSPENVFVVRNGPDLARVNLVAPDAALQARGRTILGYVGAMNPQDGLDYLLRSLSHLVNVMNRRDFYCVLIGSGDSLDELRAQAADLGLGDYVHFTGFIPDADMIRYLSTADICLDPNPSSPLNDVSTWIKVMEYMALGKPVVSFDLKETRVSAGDAALFVPPNDVAKFAEAIAQLMDDPARRRRMGQCGLARVRESLCWEMTSKNLLAAYRHLFQKEKETEPQVV
jgi:glycosyltransferase involved in cell wall biosynthesis